MEANKEVHGIIHVTHNGKYEHWEEFPILNNVWLKIHSLEILLYVQALDCYL